MEEIRAMQFPRHAKVFDEKDRAVLLFTEMVTRAPATVRENSLGELRHHFSEEQIVDLTMVICLANMTNRFNDALQVEPDLGGEVTQHPGNIQ